MRMVIAGLARLAAQPTLAQEAVAPATEAGPAPAVAEATQAEPTLSITAHIEAQSIQIRQRGRTEVSIWSDPGGKGEWKFDRHGVPNPIPLGKTFKNVAFDLDAHATIDDQGVTLGGSAQPGPMQDAPPATPPPK